MILLIAGMKDKESVNTDITGKVERLHTVASRLVLRQFVRGIAGVGIDGVSVGRSFNKTRRA